MQSSDARSPDHWRKAGQSVEPTRRQTPADPSQRQLFVDTVQRKGREQNYFFDTVDNDDEYFPFGSSSGAGAPLRDPQTNEVISKLPSIQENLWRNKNPSSNTGTNIFGERTRSFSRDNKKQEIHRFIDDVTKPDENLIYQNNFDSNNYYTRPKKQKPIHNPNHYWNDWFGRPGAGAPNYEYRKQNLEHMLEPKNSHQANYYRVYDPSESFGTPRRQFRSDHHTLYEMVPR